MALHSTLCSITDLGLFFGLQTFFLTGIVSNSSHRLRPSQLLSPQQPASFLHAFMPALPLCSLFLAAAACFSAPPIAFAWPSSRDALGRVVNSAPLPFCLPQIISTTLNNYIVCRDGSYLMNETKIPQITSFAQPCNGHFRLIFGWCAKIWVSFT